MSLKQTLSGSIALTKLPCRLMKSAKGVEGIFIPTEHAHLVKGKEGALYLPLKIIVSGKEDQYGNHGMITFSRKAEDIFGKKYGQLSKEDQEKMNKINMILGNVKDFEFEGPADAPADNTVYAEGEVPKDDMPF